MKLLYLIRHAKSSWKDTSLKDFDRPLNKRGKHDAPLMGKVLQSEGIQPDVMMSSPAKRARLTAETIAEHIGFPKKKITYEEKLYDAGEKVLLKLVRALPEESAIVMIFGHNPGLTAFANELTDSYVYNIPTTGVYCIRFEVDKWADVSEKSGQFVSFDYPKRHKE